MDKPDFWDWYNDIIDKTRLKDKRYPLKGMGVWGRYGWKIMANIDRLIRDEMDRAGHDEMCFPLLIPETEFARESEHIKGFQDEVFWVTHAGRRRLDVRSLLRPTSETAMYPIFSLWIRSHADLPLKVYQIAPAFRYETKQTRPFIREREIHFFEAHTCHETYEDAERQIEEDLRILKRIMKKLCIPYLTSKRPEWDKFAGAFYSIGIDTLMPTGEALQLGSIHQYKQNFSKPYEIKIERPDGGHDYVYQTTYGMSERLLGAIIGLHGDDLKLLLPPDIAPIQVVIIPIYSKDTMQKVLEECTAVKETLLDESFRVYLDKRDIRPGRKYYDWELKGIPLRIEIGPKDLKEKVVTFVRIDTGKRTKIKREYIANHAKLILEDISSDLLDTAEEKLKKGVIKARSVEEAKEINSIVTLPWCGKESCGKEMEDRTGKEVLGILDDKMRGNCPICGSESENPVYMAKAI